MNGKSSAELHVDRAGICREVVLDGVLVRNCAGAKIVIEPQEATRIVITVWVDQVTTVDYP